jgi:sugar lactone lactonase YvrE
MAGVTCAAAHERAAGDSVPRMTNLRWLLPVVVVLSSPLARAQVRTIALPAGSRPESITRAWCGKHYVSLQFNGTVGLNDGEIRQVDVATGTVTPFVTGLDNPRGLAFTGELLVVTDTTRLWVIDQAGNKRVLADPPAFPFPVKFFNDAAPERGGRAVFVTEMGGRDVIRDPGGLLWPTDSPQAALIPVTSRVYRVTVGGKVEISNVFTPSPKLLILNGVTQSKTAPHQLLALDFFTGSVVAVDMRRDRRDIIATGPFRGADGIEQARDGTLFVSSFENGAVWRLSPDGEQVQTLIQGVGRQSTADLALDEAAGLLYVPDSAHSTIIVLPTAP